MVRNRSIFKVRRGDGLVEAVMILPIIILIIIFIINMTVFVYSQIELKVKLDVAGNAVMGERTKTGRTLKHTPKGINVKREIQGYGFAYKTYSQTSFKKKGVFGKDVLRNLESYTYEVDEKKMIRYRDFFKR